MIIKKWSDWIDFTSGGIFAAIFGGDWKPKTSLKMVSCYSGHYRNTVTGKYIEALKDFTGYESVSLFTTGSEATEAFWRCMRVYSGKPGIWGGLVDPDEVGDDAPHADAMHGMTLGAMIMAGKMSYPTLGVWPQLGEGRFGQSPEGTCGMIIEPYHAPSAQFHREDPTMNRVRSVQKEFDMPLCVDEIQGGFGRTGKLFAHEWYQDLKPEFVTIGKGMGGGFPISALLGPKEIMESEDISEHGHMHSTHSGHPFMCHIGLQVIKKLQDEELIGESKRKGDQMKMLLDGLPVRHHSGKGMLAGVEMKNKEQAAFVTKLCQFKGLLVVDTGRKWVKIAPLLNMPFDDIKVGCAILKDAVVETLKTVPEVIDVQVS